MTKRIQVLVVVFAVTSIAMAAIIGMGLIAGSLVNYLIPDMGFGMATLCGTVAAGVVLICCLHVLITASVYSQRFVQNDGDEDDEFEADTLSDDQVGAIADQLTEAILVRLTMPEFRPSRSSRRHR